MDLLLFEAVVRDDHLELDPGTKLVVDLARHRMWTDSRIYFPNFGYIAGLQAEGKLRWITPSHADQEAIPLPVFPVRVVA